MSFDIALINGDMKIQSDGSIKTYSDTSKLRQDIIKILLTGLSTNKVYPWYGCNMANDFIAKNIPDNVVFSEINDSVIESINNLVKLQQHQSGFQELSLAEGIYKILNVSASRDISDPRQVNISVSILTKRLTKIEEVFTVIS